MEIDRIMIVTLWFIGLPVAAFSHLHAFNSLLGLWTGAYSLIGMAPTNIVAQSESAFSCAGIGVGLALCCIVLAWMVIANDWDKCARRAQATSREKELGGE